MGVCPQLTTLWHSVDGHAAEVDAQAQALEAREVAVDGRDKALSKREVELEHREVSSSTPYWQSGGWGFRPPPHQCFPYFQVHRFFR